MISCLWHNWTKWEIKTVTVVFIKFSLEKEIKEDRQFRVCKRCNYMKERVI